MPGNLLEAIKKGNLLKSVDTTQNVKPEKVVTGMKQKMNELRKQLGYDEEYESETDDDTSWQGGGMIREHTSISSNYDKIYDPKSGKYVDLLSENGKNTLKSYIKMLM